MKEKNVIIFVLIWILSNVIAYFISPPLVLITNAVGFLIMITLSK